MKLLAHFVLFFVLPSLLSLSCYTDGCRNVTYYVGLYSNNGDTLEYKLKVSTPSLFSPLEYRTSHNSFTLMSCIDKTDSIGIQIEGSRTFSQKCSLDAVNVLPDDNVLILKKENCIIYGNDSLIRCRICEEDAIIQIDYLDERELPFNDKKKMALAVFESFKLVEVRRI